MLQINRHQHYCVVFFLYFFLFMMKPYTKYFNFLFGQLFLFVLHLTSQEFVFWILSINLDSCDNFVLRSTFDVRYRRIRNFNIALHFMLIFLRSLARFEARTLMSCHRKHLRIKKKYLNFYWSRGFSKSFLKLKQLRGI